MLSQPIVRDVGEDSQDDSHENQDEDDVFHPDDAGTDGEVFTQDAVKHVEVFRQGVGTEDEVEVLSSSCCKKSMNRKRTSLSALSSSSSQTSTGLVRGDAGSTAMMKPSRRMSKAVIEASEDDDEEAQPAENLSRTLPLPDVDPLVSKTGDGADSPSHLVNTDTSAQPLLQEAPLETMIFTNSLLQTCGHASGLSASALEFQPRAESATLTTAGEIQELHLQEIFSRSSFDLLVISSPDLFVTGCYEAPGCLPHQYHDSFWPTQQQPLYQAVHTTDTQPYYTMQVLSTLDFFFS